MSWPSATLSFESCLHDLTPGQPKIQRTDYLQSGTLPIIDQGQKEFAGYTNDTANAYKGPLPVILFGDHTLVFKFVDRPFALGADGVRVLAARPPFVPKFIFYYLRSARMVSRGYSRHFKFLRELRFPNVAEKEQRRIVELLEQSDELRQQRAEADQLAGRILPALFHKMFGSLESVKPLSALADVVSGVAKGRKFNGQPPMTVPYVRVANVQDGYLDLSELKLIEALPGEVEELSLKRGDVLLTEGGDFDKLGRGAMLDRDLPDCIHQNHVFRVRCGPSKLLPEYFAAFLLSANARRYFLQCAKKTSNLASINMSQLRALPVPVPPLPLQKVFAERVREIREMETAQAESRARLECLFQSMLHRAFTGELTAKWREAHLKELLAETEKQARLLAANGKH